MLRLGPYHIGVVRGAEKGLNLQNASVLKLALDNT